MGQKFFALTSAARRVAFECDFDLSFAASRDKSPRLLSKRVEKSEKERERGEDGSTSFSSTSTCTCVSISAAQVPSRQESSSSISRRLAPTCRRSLVSCLPLSISLFPSLSLLQVGDVHKRILKFMKQQQPQRWQQQRAASESAATKRTF